MRRVATGALVLCATAMVICRWWEAEVPWLGWFRAIFEAGTIGALADWFAVVALFRHPLGLTIPHTAILPNNKGRVAQSLATFLETNFLTEEKLGPKIRSLDYAGCASQWLQENASLLAEKAVRFAPGIMNGISDDEMAQLLATRARRLIGQADFGQFAGKTLEMMVQKGRDREIYDSTLRLVRQLIEEHEETIESKIREEIPISSELLAGLPLGKEFVGPILDQIRAALAAAIAKKTIEKVESVLDEAASKPNHPLWQSFEKRLRQFISDLKSSPLMAEKVRSLQESLAAQPLMDEFSRKAWQEIKFFILRDCESSDSLIRRKLTDAIASLAGQLTEQKAARDEINQFLGDHAVAAVLATRPHARELIVSTIESWDTQEMSSRLETTVGRDLQFIRLNGTIVGGLIGGLIHGAFLLVGK